MCDLCILHLSQVVLIVILLIILIYWLMNSVEDEEIKMISRMTIKGPVCWELNRLFGMLKKPLRKLAVKNQSLSAFR